MEDRRISPEVEPVMVALALGHKRLAFVLLKQILRREQHERDESHAEEIAQLKAEFLRISGMQAYPMDFTQDDADYWDEALGHYIECVGVDPLLEDVRENGKGKWNLLYFLSADKGKRSSRWDMLVIRKNEEMREREKQEYGEAAEMVMQKLSEILRGKEPLKRVEPEWVVKMKKERDGLIAALASTEHKNGNKKEIIGRLQTIQMQVGKWERGEL